MNFWYASAFFVFHSQSYFLKVSRYACTWFFAPCTLPVSRRQTRTISMSWAILWKNVTRFSLLSPCCPQSTSDLVLWSTACAATLMASWMSERGGLRRTDGVDSCTSTLKKGCSSALTACASPGLIKSCVMDFLDRRAMRFFSAFSELLVQLSRAWYMKWL